MRISDWSSDVCSSDLAGHDWPALIALAAATHRRRYGDMALALLTAETAALPSLLAPLRLDRAALAPLEISLVRLSGRSLAGRDRKSTRLNSSHSCATRMPSSSCNQTPIPTHKPD